MRAIDDGEAGLAALDAEIANAGETAAANRATALEARTRLAEIETEARTLRTVLGPAGRPGEAAAAIADALEVETGYETALGAALGDDLDVPADDRAPVRWSLLPQPTTPDPALPADLEPLAAKVSGAPALQRRLAQIGLVATKADGDRLQATLAPGQRLVTKNGDLWRWDGFVAASDGATAAARRLAQKNRLAALAGEEAAARQRAEHAAAAEQEAAGALSGLEARRTAARDDLRRLRAALAEDTRRLEQVRERRRKADAEAARRTGDRDRLFEDLETARTAETDLASDLSTLDEAALAAAERAQADAQTKARAARDAQSEARAALTALKREADARARRIATLRGEIADWRERRKAAAAHIAELTRRRDDLDRERETVAALPEDIAARRSEHDAAVAAAEAEHRAAGDALATAQTEHRAAQAALREAQAAHAEAREARARAEARNEAAAQALESETQRIRETLSVTPEACLAIAEREEADDTPLPRRADIERHLSRLKADRDRLGGVNLQADDDLEKIGGEIARIVAERDDVLEGVAKLRGAIGQLNREGRKRLADAFKSVDEHFQRLFAILFGGGEACLQLIENADDPLQGGLEIIARPPGKKPATLSLLSGGEQTLTALSLIFAVFLTNPSPICVLDEVDAPLDDANVDRFCTMMEQMAAETETRFLVITHHPMTMTRMNRLFGVTMAEKGVSQLVSVDLETAQGFREAS